MCRKSSMVSATSYPIILCPAGRSTSLSQWVTSVTFWGHSSMPSKCNSVVVSAGKKQPHDLMPFWINSTGYLQKWRCRRNPLLHSLKLLLDGQVTLWLSYLPLNKALLMVCIDYFKAKHNLIRAGAGCLKQRAGSLPMRI